LVKGKVKHHFYFHFLIPFILNAGKTKNQPRIWMIPYIFCVLSEPHFFHSILPSWIWLADGRGRSKYTWDKLR